MGNFWFIIMFIIGFLYMNYFNTEIALAEPRDYFNEEFKDYNIISINIITIYFLLQIILMQIYLSLLGKKHILKNYNNEESENDFKKDMPILLIMIIKILYLLYYDWKIIILITFFFIIIKIIIDNIINKENIDKIYNKFFSILIYVGKIDVIFIKITIFVCLMLIIISLFIK